MGRGAGRANHSGGFFWCSSPTTKVRKLLWRENEEGKPQSHLSDGELTFLNPWDTFSLFSWRRACLGKAEPLSPHTCSSIRMMPLPAGCEGVYPAGPWCALAACLCWTSGGIFGSCLGNMQMIPSIRHPNYFGCQKRFLFLCVIFLKLFLSQELP